MHVCGEFSFSFSYLRLSVCISHTRHTVSYIGYVYVTVHTDESRSLYWQKVRLLPFTRLLPKHAIKVTLYVFARRIFHTILIKVGHEKKRVFHLIKMVKYLHLGRRNNVTQLWNTHTHIRRSGTIISIPRSPSVCLSVGLSVFLRNARINNFFLTWL